jgi:hypothetical protein
MLSPTQLPVTAEWQQAWRAFEYGVAYRSLIEESRELELIECDRPVFEVHLDGRVFASSQNPAKAKALFEQMTSGESAKRYGDTGRVTFEVRNDRRAVAR